jgi:hypothetical protein
MSENDITQALIPGDDIETGVGRELLRYAVQRAIFCPYCQKVLDVRDAVLLDGTGHGGRMDIMHAAEYDFVIEKTGSLEKLEQKFGYKVDILNGRELFS